MLFVFLDNLRLLLHSLGPPGLDVLQVGKEKYSLALAFGDGLHDPDDWVGIDWSRLFEFFDEEGVLGGHMESLWHEVD